MSPLPAPNCHFSAVYQRIREGCLAEESCDTSNAATLFSCTKQWVEVGGKKILCGEWDSNSISYGSPFPAHRRATRSENSDRPWGGPRAACARQAGEGLERAEMGPEVGWDSSRESGFVLGLLPLLPPLTSAVAAGDCGSHRVPLAWREVPLVSLFLSSR